ncbi:Acetyl esterase/lipase [Luteibacter sp. 329MFSha]|nr:Acetyl esterase/lipase [Luteibacter sp. 329MFSha]
MTGMTTRRRDESTPMTDTPSNLRLAARDVPFPSSISDAARASLERLVGADGAPVNARYVMPPPEDRAAWSRMKTAVDAQYGAAAREAAGALVSTVETITLGDTVVHVATPAGGVRADRAYIELHGGALVFGGGEACAVGARKQADLHGVRCYGVDYRTPPDHPYPAALDDCLVTYRHLLERHAPEHIIVGGRSAGGNLAAAMLLRARDEGLPMPAALVLLSPEVDLTESGDSFEVHRFVDVVLVGSLMSNNRLYADGADLSAPYLSPLFGDLAGFPPTFLQSGTRDLFLSNAVRMHRKLRQAGVHAELHVFEAMPHGGFGGHTPEDAELAAEVRAFVASHWG